MDKVSPFQFSELFLAHRFQDDFEEVDKRRQFFTCLFLADVFLESVEVEFLELGDVLVREHTAICCCTACF